jgi:glycosyltransferase involved in cell wall biosynthesis
MKRGADRPPQEGTELRTAAPGLRVAIVAPGEIFGGAERQILTLMRTLHLRGCAIKLLVFHDAELARRARSGGIATYVLGARGVLDLESLGLLRRSLDEFAADVAHLHGYRAAVYCGLVRRRSFAVVKTEHGSLEMPSDRPLERLKLHVYRRLETWATRRLHAHVVYVTEDLRRLASPAFVPSSVIHNGIESVDLRQTKMPSEYQAGYVNVAIVGRLERIKGLDYAIRAMKAPRMPPTARLHIVGAGPMLPELRALARELGVQDRVLFLGFRDNVYDYIAHADALLMPSLHEGLPYTILEAMALGTPILATKVGGLAEILVHERTALLFEPAREDDIAEAVARVSADSILSSSLTSHALAETRTSFSADVMADRYLTLFRAIRSPC